MTLIYSHAVIKTPEGDFLMQSRGYNPGITNPGGISLFGGGQEADETPVECLIRELDEELELKVTEDQTKLIWVSEGVGADKVTPAERHFYLIENVDQAALLLHEGDAILSMTFEEILAEPAVPSGLKSKFMEYRKLLYIDAKKEENDNYHSPLRSEN